MARKHNAFRGGKVHVCEHRCDTCVFRAGNLMRLTEGRLESMVADAVRNETAIICHSTLDGDNAVCRGFFDSHKTQPLQLAERLGMVELQSVEARSE